MSTIWRLRFTANGTGAAMGLRLMSVEVSNCGSEPLELNGYPHVKVLDAQREQLDTAILEGSGGITGEPVAEPRPAIVSGALILLVALPFRVLMAPCRPPRS